MNVGQYEGAFYVRNDICVCKNILHVVWHTFCILFYATRADVIQDLYVWIERRTVVEQRRVVKRNHRVVIVVVCIFLLLLNQNERAAFRRQSLAGTLHLVFVQLQYQSCGKCDFFKTTESKPIVLGGWSVEQFKKTSFRRRTCVKHKYRCVFRKTLDLDLQFARCL